MSVKEVQYVLMPACSASTINYRRIQVTEQQSEKQKMNLLQKCLIFTHRATELMLEEWVPSTVPQTSAYHIGAWGLFSVIFATTDVFHSTLDTTG